jgi:hypothetical protein
MFGAVPSGILRFLASSLAVIRPMLKALVLDSSSILGSQGTKTPRVGLAGFFFPMNGIFTSCFWFFYDSFYLSLKYFL